MKTDIQRSEASSHPASDSDARRHLPSVEKVVQLLEPHTLPRSLLVDVVRQTLSELRRRDVPVSSQQALGEVRAVVETIAAQRLRPVINATGVPLHTNLGRAPLSDAAVAALGAVAANYNNVEFDLPSGTRKGRAPYVERALALACAAEAAAVVNNGAAALILAVRHFTRERRDVVISRGELVQIGGGFRIPEIIEASGARLREVGTTNQTTVDDYRAALGPETGLILKIHRSNFFMDGFVASPAPESLAQLAHERNIALVEDLGSGALIDTGKLNGIHHEPTPPEVLARGVDLVTFSGDKLLGGPQAGIIAGQGEHVAALKREPFFRALRCDKLVLAAVEATVDSYLRGKAETTLPLLQMLALTPHALRMRAEDLIAKLPHPALQATVQDSTVRIGGGSLPQSEIASIAIELRPVTLRVDDLARRLRQQTYPVVCYIRDGALCLDLRTVFPRQDAELAAAIVRALDDD